MSKKPALPEPLAMPSITRGAVQPVSGGASPHVTDDTLRAIGAVAVAWAKLENALNDLIWTSQGKDLQTGRTATQDLQITALLSTLQKTMQEHLNGDNFSNERRAVDNIIKFIHATKEERNYVIHGSWATVGNMPGVCSLRADTPSLDLVTFEHYPRKRLNEIRDYANSANKSVMALIYRLESLRENPSDAPRI